MSADAVRPKLVFRHGFSGAHPRLVIGISVAFVLSACVVAIFAGRQWLLLTILCGLAVSQFGYLAWLKVEISETAFSHRNMSGNHVFEFAQVDDALFEAVSTGYGYAPVFSVRLRGGTQRKQVPICMFPVRAAAVLFTRLERYGIQIREDGSRLVEREMRQIRQAQVTQPDA